ncbi:hypothetical protein N9A45_00655 [bacterium]|nr:hypothetical protein [bacterium]
MRQNRAFLILLSCLFVTTSAFATDSCGVALQECPTDEIKVVVPSKNRGSLKCLSENCAKLSKISCVGLKVSEPGVCYHWKCDGIPYSLDDRTTIQIPGPDYDVIEVDIAPRSELTIIFVLMIAVMSFAACPEFTAGACFMSLLQSESYTDYEFSS